MGNQEALRDLPEWILQEALFRSLPPSPDERNRDFSPIWRQTVVYLVDAPRCSKAFAEIFSATKPTIRKERPFTQADREAYRIDEAEWLRSYQSVRPDFVVSDPTSMLLLFFDAKRPRPEPSTWDDPKEAVYCRALESSNAEQRAFVYIISRYSAEDCFAALRAFQSSEILGAIFWEDLLPSIYAGLLVEAEAWAGRQPQGAEALQKLRAWRPSDGE